MNDARHTNRCPGVRFGNQCMKGAGKIIFYKTVFFLVFSLTLHLVSRTAFSQTPYFLWADRIGGTGQVSGNSVAVDQSGFIYTSGYFDGTVDFDPGPGIFNLTSSGSYDIYITKSDSSGNLIRAIQIGNSSHDQYCKLTIDTAGNLYASGQFNSATDFDPGPGTFNMSSVGGPDVFILKLDSAGNFIWAKQFGGSGEARPYALVVDANGNVFTSGGFTDTADFDPGPGIYNLTSSGQNDIFITKLDSSGNLAWARQMGSYTTDIGSSIALDANGNVYTTGIFIDTVDFDPGPGIFQLISAGSADAFVLKLDPLGNFIWAGHTAGAYTQSANGIGTDSAGNVYVAGTFQGTVDFNPGTGTYPVTSAGSLEVYIFKWNASGNFVYAKKFGNIGIDQSLSLAVDASGNSYTSGLFSYTVDFDPGPGTFNLICTSNAADMFVLKLNPSGQFIFAGQVSGQFIEEGYSIVTDTSGNIYMTGRFAETVDFDPGSGIQNMTYSGITDAFILKWYDCSHFNSLITASGPTSICLGDSVILTADPTAGNWQWYRNGSPIPGAAMVSYTAKTRGTYHCMSQIPSQCTIASNRIKVKIICFPPDPPIDRIAAYPDEAEGYLSINPNPGAGLFSVVSSYGRLKILNSIGEVVFFTEINTPETTFDLSHLPDGVYFVMFETVNRMFYQKLMLLR